MFKKYPYSQALVSLKTISLKKTRKSDLELYFYPNNTFEIRYVKFYSLKMKGSIHFSNIIPIFASNCFQHLDESSLFFDRKQNHCMQHKKCGQILMKQLKYSFEKNTIFNHQIYGLNFQNGRSNAQCIRL